MPDTSIASLKPRNHLLAALPPASLERLKPLLTPVEMPLRQVLHSPDEPIERVYFPESGWVSMLAVLEDGDCAEVGLTGREGMVGLPVVLGADREDVEAIVQSGGTALSADANAFRAELAANPPLMSLLLRYALVHLGQIARTAACNGHHVTEQRLARWLLMSHDRAEADEFPMTHEFLSLMLGVRRAGVSVAANVLQKAGLISYERGRIAITDRPGLEAASCECYGIVRRASDRLFKPHLSKRDRYRD